MVYTNNPPFKEIYPIMYFLESLVLHFVIYETEGSVQALTELIEEQNRKIHNSYQDFCLLWGNLLFFFLID